MSYKNFEAAQDAHDRSLLFDYDYKDEKEVCECCDKELNDDEICISKYNETFCCECLELAEKERQ